LIYFFAPSVFSPSIDILFVVYPVIGRGNVLYDFGLWNISPPLPSPGKASLFPPHRTEPPPPSPFFFFIRQLSNRPNEFVTPPPFIRFIAPFPQISARGPPLLFFFSLFSWRLDCFLHAVWYKTPFLSRPPPPPWAGSPFLI